MSAVEMVGSNDATVSDDAPQSTTAKIPPTMAAVCLKTLLCIVLYSIYFIKHVLSQDWSSSSYKIIGSSVDEEVECGVISPAETSPSTISSPMYPDNYPRYSKCAWLIRGDPDEAIIFQFVDMDIEVEEDCPFDAIRIYDGPTKEFPLVVNHCGTGNIPPDFTSSTPYLLVEFESDGSDSGRGFQARYTSKKVITNTDDEDTDEVDESLEGWTPGIDSDGCSKTIRAINGTITSPDYPDRYPNDAECTLIITAPPGYMVTLEFKSMDMEDFHCNFDYIEIRDGEFEDSDSQGIYCGTRLPETFTSSQESIRIDFISDAADNRLGFQAVFTSIATLSLQCSQRYRYCVAVPDDSIGQSASPKAVGDSV
ncbi:neuropilin-2-like [Anneissia japonica]|uniref:neuropilin-2-like n=1 Tax=Anneissia japonica TaxID=1529436 RepID=UPI0014256B72|nr:neuropilin-2-like [Anneissia japonica]